MLWLEDDTQKVCIFEFELKKKKNILQTNICCERFICFDSIVPVQQDHNPAGLSVLPCSWVPSSLTAVVCGQTENPTA